MGPVSRLAFKSTIPSRFSAILPRAKDGKQTPKVLVYANDDRGPLPTVICPPSHNSLLTRPPAISNIRPLFLRDSLVVQSVERRTVNPYVTGSSPVEGANSDSLQFHLSTKNERHAPKQCTIGGSVVSLLFRFSYPASIKHHKIHPFDFIAFYFFNSFLLHACKAL